MMPVLSPTTTMPASLAFAPAVPSLAAPEILLLEPGRMATSPKGATAASAFELDGLDTYLPARASVELPDGLPLSGLGLSSGNTQATVGMASPSPPKEDEGFDARWPTDFSSTTGPSSSVTSCPPLEQWSTPVLESQTSTMGDRLRDAVLNRNRDNLKQLLSECWAHSTVAVPPQRPSSIDWFEAGVAPGGASKAPPQNCCGVTSGSMAWPPKQSGLTSSALLPAKSDVAISPAVHELAAQDSPRALPDFADLLCAFHVQHPISGLEAVFNVSHHCAATVAS